jgi:hypothetical protein
MGSTPILSPKGIPSPQGDAAECPACEGIIYPLPLHKDRFPFPIPHFCFRSSS